MAQFEFNIAPAPPGNTDAGYAVFGRGMANAAQITASGGHQYDQLLAVARDYQKYKFQKEQYEADRALRTRQSDLYETALGNQQQNAAANRLIAQENQDLRRQTYERQLGLDEDKRSTQRRELAGQQYLRDMTGQNYGPQAGANPLVQSRQSDLGRMLGLPPEAGQINTINSQAWDAMVGQGTRATHGPGGYGPPTESPIITRADEKAAHDRLKDSMGNSDETQRMFGMASIMGALNANAKLTNTTAVNRAELLGDLQILSNGMQVNESTFGMFGAAIPSEILTQLNKSTATVGYDPVKGFSLKTKDGNPQGAGDELSQWLNTHYNDPSLRLSMDRFVGELVTNGALSPKDSIERGGAVRQFTVGGKAHQERETETFETFQSGVKAGRLKERGIQNETATKNLTPSVEAHQPPKDTSGDFKWDDFENPAGTPDQSANTGSSLDRYYKAIGVQSEQTKSVKARAKRDKPWSNIDGGTHPSTQPSTGRPWEALSAKPPLQEAPLMDLPAGSGPPPQANTQGPPPSPAPAQTYDVPPSPGGAGQAPGRDDIENTVPPPAPRASRGRSQSADHQKEMRLRSRIDHLKGVSPSGGAWTGGARPRELSTSEHGARLEAELATARKQLEALLRSQGRLGNSNLDFPLMTR